MKIGWRVWLLIIMVVFSILAIRPSFESGALVKSVDKNSEFLKQGLHSGEVIIGVNGQTINSKMDYTNAINNIVISPQGTKIEIQTKANDYIVLANSTPGITVADMPRTKIQTGLDLQGGARALIQPEIALTDSQLQDLIDISRNRFNVYGLSDVQIRGVSDLTGNKYMLLEIAGATPNDLEELVSKQGKFEAKVGNKTVFEGGKKDISDVCRNDATCSAIVSCDPVQGGYACQFRFTLYLTEEAAKKHADITRDIPLDPTNPKYLAEKLYLYVDDVEVESLYVGADLRGQQTTQISIQGSGSGLTQEEAYNAAKADMNKLQTVLITGSLPYKLNIVKLDTISPVLGNQFTYLLIMAGVSAIVLVGIIVFVRYRRFKASLALLATSFAEIVIILGFAALVSWNLDLPSIAGILATIGTGVDQQIVILDEARRGVTTGIKEKLKRALFIIVSAYFTALVAMLPLFWAGAGLFKGFAFTTIVGITAGVLISRPAFSEMIGKIEGKE